MTGTLLLYVGAGLFATGLLGLILSSVIYAAKKKRRIKSLSEKY